MRVIVGETSRLNAVWKKDVAVHRLAKSHSLKRSQEAIGEGIDSVATDTQCAGDTRTLVSSSRTAMNVE